MAAPEVGWFYARNKQKHGPIGLAELRRLANSGQLQPTDMVCQQGATRWQAAANVAGLFHDPVPTVAAQAIAAPSVRPLPPTAASPPRPAVEAVALETVDGQQQQLTGSQVNQSRPSSSAPDLLALGSFGRYRILKRLGQGGMGAVYLAHDQQLDRRVALKVPHFTSHDGPEVLERFHREARSAATLDHPHICPVHDVGEINGTHYMTMAYIEGKSLAEHIDPNQPLPQRQAAALVRKLALALHEAHLHGVVHRDLKPANVMINKRGEPVVMDFGLARRQNQESVRLTQTGTIMGTPAYMSPEQVDGVMEAIGPSTDIYSLGVILYELLTAHLPFSGSTAAILGQIMAVEPVAPSQHRPDLEPLLEGICRKAMAKKVADRYGSTADLATALEEYLREEGPAPAATPVATMVPVAEPVLPLAVAVEPQPAQRRAHNKWRRRVVILAAGAALMLLGVVILVPTKHGTIRIELSDPAANVEVKVDGEAVQFTGLREPLRLRTGPHHLIVTGKDFETISESFTMRRGDNPALRVTLMAKPTESKKPAKSSDSKAALTLASRASSNLDNGDLEQAIAECDAAIKLDPQCARAYFVRALAYQGQDDFDKAIADLTESIRLDSNDPDAYGNRAVTYCYRSRDKGDRRDLDRALEDANAQVKLAPRGTLSYSTRGLARTYRGDHDLAIADCNKSLEIDPENWQALSTRGLAYLNKGDYDSAIADLSKVLEAGVRNVEHYVNRGQAYFKTAKYDQAIADYTSALKLDPDSALAYQFRGDAYAKKGDMAKATADHAKATALKKK